MYDIIGDIHADYNRLKAILVKLGFLCSHKGWHHPDGRKAIFVGDLIDSGTDNYLVYRIVREMVESGNALCVMGNHEFNSILFHNYDSNGNPLREHSDKNIKQHQSFLTEAPLGSEKSYEMVDWFMTLPLFLDLDEFRVVHAYWHQESILNLKNSTGNILTRDTLLNASDDDDFYRVSIDIILNGMEIDLPPGSFFMDTYNVKRERFRFKWWGDKTDNLYDVMLSVFDKSNIENVKISSLLSQKGYSDEDKPVFVGHYKLENKPKIEQSNVLCLDYPKIPVAYRFNSGDRFIKAENIVLV